MADLQTSAADSIPQIEHPFGEMLLARGLASSLARRLALNFKDWPTLKAAAATGIEGISPDELAQIKRASARREIPQTTVHRLVCECEFRCCLCWDLDKDSGVIIHHIRPHEEAPDDSYDNLVVLCPEHHSRVHTSWELARHPIPPDLLRVRKAAFVAAVVEFRAGRRPAPGREAASAPRSISGPPLPPANFTGRQTVTNEVRAKILGPRRRIALVGMGGVGKTAIALNAINALRPAFPGGVFWFEAESDAVVTQPLLRSLIHFLDGDPGTFDLPTQIGFARELLNRRVRLGALLLGVDNVPASALQGLAPLLSTLPQGVGLLLTSRETTVGVSLDAENISVAPMTRPESELLLSVVSGAETATLGREKVERLLDSLGNLPLAIELVGRQIAVRIGKPSFDLAALCDRLQQFNVPLLSFPGHRGVPACFALSYESLNDNEQTLFCLVGEFANGPVLLDQISSVSGLKQEIAEDVMDGLVSLSLLNWGGLPKEYRIHPLLHKYAAHQFRQYTKERQQIFHKSFVRYFRAQLLSQKISFGDDVAGIDALFENLCRAIRIGAELGSDEAVSDIVGRLAAGTGYFQLRSLTLESVPLLELAIASAKNLKDENAIAAHTANLGGAYHRMGRLKEAFSFYESAIAIVRKTGNAHDLASNLQKLGGAMLAEGKDPIRAEKILREALDAALRSENADALIGTLGTLGSLCRQVGRLADAKKFYSDALNAARIARIPLAEGNNLSNLGLIENDLGNKEKAASMVREALGIARRIGDKTGEGNRLGHLGGFVIDRAKHMRAGPERYCLFEEGRELLTQALRIAEETRDPEKLACWLMNLGCSWTHSGHYERAEPLYVHALEVAIASGYAHIEGQILFNVGTLHTFMGRPDAALQELRKAAKVLRRIRSPMADEAELRAEQLRFAIRQRTHRR